MKSDAIASVLVTTIAQQRTKECDAALLEEGLVPQELNQLGWHARYENLDDGTLYMTIYQLYRLERGAIVTCDMPALSTLPVSVEQH